MMATGTLPLSSSELEYLLLDDLYEALDGPMDWEIHDWELQDAVIPILDFLLAMDRQRDLSPGDPENWFLAVPDELQQHHTLLYLRLADFRDGLASHRCSRSTIETVRDAVLVWIQRVQHLRRDLHRAGRQRHRRNAGSEKSLNLSPWMRRSGLPNRE